MTQQIFPGVDTTFLLPGPQGNLEVATTTYAENISSHSAVAIVCHPHPLYGGTMQNKVVSTLVRTFKELGLRTVRFNFRGVGKSEGVFDNGIGELDDLMAVINWVKSLFPEAPLWLSGFSFGSYIATKAAIQLNPEKLICIAPPVINFNMRELPLIPCPWIVVQGDQDEVVSPDAVFAWAEAAKPQPIIIRMPGAGHFFHGRLLELRERLGAVLVG